jgi:hypothetical protein
MPHLGKWLIAVVILSSTVGCSAKVETTEDSTKTTVEGPKIEVGDKPLDADPSTDDDVDVDTPVPGDN